MVEGYEGRPGSGKTATMVWLAWRSKQMGRRIHANIPLIDNRTIKRRSYYGFGRCITLPRDANSYGRSWADGPILQTLEEAIKLDNVKILLDEVHMWAGADKWAGLSFEFRRFLAQQRKEGVDIDWTAQSAARVFNVIRELTACLWSCSRYGPMSVRKGRDPESREDMGTRYLPISDQVFNLYNTMYIVGDGKGTEGEYGVNERYTRRADYGVEILGTGRKPLPAYAVLDRHELPGGRVVYVRDGERASWWQHRTDELRGLTEAPTGVAPDAAAAGGVPVGGPSLEEWAAGFDWNELLAEGLNPGAALDGSHELGERFPATAHDRTQEGPLIPRRLIPLVKTARSVGLG